MLTVNSPLPHFETVDQDGTRVSNETLRDSWAVLYFYPKDDTPGCTAQACSFRDANTELQEAGVAVYGISGGTAASHQKFREKFSLNFPLLLDPDHEIAEAFNTWVEKSMYGKKYMGIERSTFIVRPDGTLAIVLRKVKPEGHAALVLEEIKKLQAS